MNFVKPYLQVKFEHELQVYDICHPAVIAQLGERKTEDLEVAGSIPACGIILLAVSVLPATFNAAKTELSAF